VQAPDFTGLRFIVRKCKITNCISVTDMFALATDDFYFEIADSFIGYYESFGIRIHYPRGIIKIHNNTFTSGCGDAIILEYNGRYYEICRNTITSNYGSGIYLDALACYGIVKDNLIMYNAEAGLKLRPCNNEHLVVMNNYIARNGIGVKFNGFAQQLRCDIVHNDIHSNAEYDMVSAPGGEGVIINATYNYWGTTSRNEIEQRIYHFFDDFNLREVYYRPYLNASTRAQLFGYLIDFSTNTPIENATVSAIGMTFIQVNSNTTGYFSLEGLLPGEYLISISKEGYETVTWFESVGAAQAFESSISMKRLEGYAVETTTVFNVNVDGEIFPVAVTTNSTVSDFNFSLEYMQISFKVAGVDGTVGFCNVTVPNMLLGGPYAVFVNDAQITPIVSSNGTHSFIYFTYNHSEKTIKIVGTSVIPEFPTTSYLATFLALSLTVIMFNKNRKMKRWRENLHNFNLSQ